MTTETTDADRAFVLGLDGVPWYLIEEWVEDGKLPNFSRLVEEGAAGPLESTMPPTTALAWPTIATGTWADKHGVYSFRDVQSDYTNRMNTSNDLKQPELWDVLSPAVVGNVPMTYPADEIDGKMVTGMMTPEIGEGFTHPPELREEIEEKIPNYDVGLSWDEYHGRQDEFLADLADLLTARRKLLRQLMETDDWRLFFFVFTAPDRLQHLIWDDDVLLGHYRELDDILGEVLDYVEERDANLFVVSDHGFGPVETYVHTNTFLEREGFLSRKGGSSRGALEKLGLTKDKVRGAINAMGINEKALYDHLPDSIVESLASSVPGTHELFDVDFEETVAFTHGSGDLYINDTERFDSGIVEPEDVPEVKARVRERLEALQDPQTGETILNVYDGDELFVTDPESPDLVVRAVDGYLVGNSLTDRVFRDSEMDATHRSEGVFFAWGPNVGAETTPEDATVADVAPTLLHSLGEAVPDHADGRVLSEVFDDDSKAARRAVSRRAYDTAGPEDAVEADFDDVESRLQGLGYME
ncbi:MULTISPECIES: alkaline phosphatase family protein [Halorussus]|uniref:alkaline phosphatase family protein n=1 Tax=Halorussus TaxID=1070314 RepID=UPI00209F6017|nr:alkaline phosphatase family protein [Halorussus vallis]USZ76557.1 alkaline phosphatase family protein [Halorussus vallis]